MEKTMNNYRDFSIQQLKLNLKHLRTLNGRSLSEISGSEYSDFTKDALFRWEDEHDSRCPSISSIVKLCLIYNVDLETLVLSDIGGKTHMARAITLLSTYPKLFIQFFKDFFNALGNTITEVNGVTIRQFDVVSQGYIALKVLRQHNSLGKPLHFLTIFPNSKKQTLRFVFSFKIPKQGADFYFSNPPYSMLSEPSIMGASFTLGQKTADFGTNNLTTGLYIIEKEQHPFSITEIVEISRKALELVIEKKKP